MEVLGIIMARAGSKGLPDKCVRDLLGRPVIAYTFDHAAAATRLTAVVFSTDSEPAKRIAEEAGIEIVDRPAALASDTATVDSAARHAVETWESRHGRRVDDIVLLYGNIPVRANGLIDRAIEHLTLTGADSVRSVAPVSKQHPDWIHRLDDDRMRQFRTNSIYRRQDLEPFYYHDGAVAAVTREALFGALKTPDDHQSFLGSDRRAIVQQPEDSVDIDGPVDLFLAEAILRSREAPSAPLIAVGSKSVGAGKPVFLIAEAGVNHNGSVETALKMVDAAVAAGADAIKFQAFNASALASASAETAAYQCQQTGQSSQREMLAKLELSFADFARIKNRCDECGILFMATPFGIPEIGGLIELGVPAIKIASTDLTNGPLIDAAAATGLPLIVSTGASREAEIREAVRHLRRSGATDRLVLMHCVSCYPAPESELNLLAIGTLARTFGVRTGLSDHSTSLVTGALAVVAGACVVEKHFTLDRNAPGPDHALSLDPSQLKQYLAAIREAEQMRGDGKLGFRPIERPIRDAARRSITAAVDIPAGAVLAADMLALKRPGTGLAPNELPRVIGQKAVIPIARDTVLSWEMVEGMTNGESGMANGTE